MNKLRTALFLLLFNPYFIVAQTWTELGGNNSLQANGHILAICFDASGNVYAAGNFVLNSPPRRDVAKWDGTAWSVLGVTDSYNEFFTICSDNAGNIYAGGFMTNDSSHNYVAKWDGNAWTELGGLDSLAATNWIHTSLADNNGNIYVAGAFTNAINGRYVAKYDGVNWSELGGTDSLSAGSFIASLCMDPSGNLYATGNFLNIPFSWGHRYVAKFDGTLWSELGGFDALSANDGIASVISDNAGNIYAAGLFTNTAGYNYVAKWDGLSWSELGGTNSLAANFRIYALCADSAGNIYAAGGFTNASGNKYVAKYDGTSWSELGGANALAANDWIYALKCDAAGNIYAAGDFTNSNGNYYVAKFGAAPSGFDSQNNYGVTLSLSPNPATSHITLSNLNPALSYTISITDVLGHSIITQTHKGSERVGVDVAALAGGVYFVVVEGDGVREVKKMMKH